MSAQLNTQLNTQLKLKLNMLPLRLVILTCYSFAPKLVAATPLLFYLLDVKINMVFHKTKNVSTNLLKITI